MIEWFSMIFNAILGALIASRASTAPEIWLGRTLVVGAELPQLNVEFFGGIPYAEPPVGSLRLRPPVLKTSLGSATFDASKFGSSCLQPSHTPPDTGAIAPENMSEDCLSINVFRPAGITRNASLPVLFWTYGGGFFWGGSEKYDGSSIVAHSVARGTPVIYVSFNYRLGPLGFPQGQEAYDKGLLNLGMKDQLAALQWVHQNIGFFGGDKQKVTMFGQSAGAVMTAIHFLNPEIEKYARGAIFQSGSAATPPPTTAVSREGRWQDFVQEVPSCRTMSKAGNTIDCLRRANSRDVSDALQAVLSNQPEFHSYRITLDGPGGFLPESPSNFYARGEFARLPFIAGTVLDEGTIFFPRTIASEDLVRTWLVANFTPSSVRLSALEERAEELLRLYPNETSLGSPFGTGNETFGMNPAWKKASAIYGDIFFQSLRRQWIQTAVNAGVKTFGYLFTEPDPETEALGLGVHHSSELSYLYGSRAKGPPKKLLSETMMDYWISFAVNLDPNDSNGVPRPKWDQYTPKNQVLMQLNGENMTSIPDTYRSEQIDFINASPLVFSH